MLILISWLHQNPADLGLHSFQGYIALNVMRTVHLPSRHKKATAKHHLNAISMAADSGMRRSRMF